MRLGVICAMDKELNLFLKSFSNVKHHAKDVYFVTTEPQGGSQIIIAKCGIGKVNASICAKTLIDQYGVTSIISTGVAGGADDSVRVGDIVIGNSYCYCDVFCGSPNEPGQIQGMPPVFPSSFNLWMERIVEIGDVHLGTIATSDRFVQNKDEVETLRRNVPASCSILAVDMESAAIAHVCFCEHVSFMAVRVISDNPLNPRQEVQYESFWNDMAEKSFRTLAKIIR